MIRRPRPKKVLLTLWAVAIGAPAMAGLIYNGVPSAGPDGSGRIEFADGATVHHGIGAAGVRDALANIESFDFTIAYAGPSQAPIRTGDTFAFQALASVAVSGEYLCSGRCGAPSTVAAKGTIPGLRFRTSKVESSDPSLWNTLVSWSSTDLFARLVSRQTQAAEAGSGIWQHVVVPKPSTVMLVLLGLGFLGFARRRVTRR